jgi:hypothetical protein
VHDQTLTFRIELGVAYCLLYAIATWRHASIEAWRTEQTGEGSAVHGLALEIGQNGCAQDVLSV